jgi:GxxExxY protein
MGGAAGDRMCAITVNRVLGPGSKESIYVEAMCIEMDAQGLTFEREKPLKVLYQGHEIFVAAAVGPFQRGSVSRRYA